MPNPVYIDTSIFVEMGAKRSKLKKHIRDLLKALQEDKVRVYTSIITVEEVSVAVFQRGTKVKDTYGDVSALARVYGLTKDVALTAAKHEAAIKDIALAELAKRDPKKPETEEQKLERICENRRRKWDCFHLATAQVLGCEYLYITDEKLQRRPGQLGIKNIKALSPETPVASIRGPLVENINTETV